jgi:hypothetical protein
MISPDLIISSSAMGSTLRSLSFNASALGKFPAVSEFMSQKVD